jgi:hypothetical protein
MSLSVASGNVTGTPYSNLITSLWLLSIYLDFLQGADGAGEVSGE